MFDTGTPTRSRLLFIGLFPRAEDDARWFLKNRETQYRNTRARSPGLNCYFPARRSGLEMFLNFRFYRGAAHFVIVLLTLSGENREPMARAGQSWNFIRTILKTRTTVDDGLSFEENFSSLALFFCFPFSLSLSLSLSLSFEIHVDEKTAPRHDSFDTNATIISANQ